MATSLPNFPEFAVKSADGGATDTNSAIRWQKWIEKFENMLCALDINEAKRKKALLLHYCGEDTYDIYDSFSNEKKGVGATRTISETETTPDEYNVLKTSFTEYFTPKHNLTYESYKFGQAKQQPGESMDSYYTRLRTLASTCDFDNKDKAILNQIMQGCVSSRLRRRALRENLTLDRVIEEARAIELAESRATEMEGRVENVNQVFQGRDSRGRSHSRGHGRVPRGDRGRAPRGRARSRNQGAARNSQPQDQCRNCGGKRSHPKCPAQGQECRSCGKLNHWARVCRSSAKHVNFASADKPDDNKDNYNVYDRDYSSDDSDFVFTVTNDSKHQIPLVHAKLFDTDVEFLVDTGSSCNIINESIYNELECKPVLCSPTPVIYAYGTNTPLPCLGYFVGKISYRNKSVKTEVYVVQYSNSRHSRCLLGASTAQSLNMIKFAFASSLHTPVANNTSSIVGQYPLLFDGKMGKIKGVQVKLHINSDVQPISQRHRRIPFHIRKDVENELKRLEDLDVIERVSGPTPWVSPVVVVPKKSSSGVRVCIDMREANKAISREKHPMPTVEDLMADLNSSTVFSKLDLSNAYHQLVLDESSRFITTFTTHVGLRRYKRLLFGVNAASEIFQKVIADLLAGIPGSRNLSDDIIVHGKSQADHDHALKLTLDKLSSCGAKLNRDKCTFSVNKITFFGHVFSNVGVSADPVKIKSIIGREAPKNPAEVRSFLGMTQYVSRYIPRYATLTEPLRRLTRQDVPWSWSEEAHTSFENLKTALSSTDVMSYFDPKKSTEVLVDASPVGVSAILTQDGMVVSYGSRALTDVEQRYSQTEREMLAVVYGVEHFHIYLFASEFKVITDHKPLLGIVHSQKQASARLERWRLRLMPYQFTLEYRPGKDDLNPADYMSRHPFEKPKRDNAAEAYVSYVSRHAVPKSLSLDEVREATRTCPFLQNLMIAVQNGHWWNDPSLTPYLRFRDEFSIYDGVVLRDHRLVIPDSLQKRVVDIAHKSHQGVVKTKQLIRDKVWFPGIDKVIEDAVRACIPCQASYPGPSKREPICPTTLPSSPWSEVAVDFAGPFPSGQYLLVIVDEYSRYPEVEIVHSTAAKVVIPRLQAIFARQGYPDVLKSDNGPPFQGPGFADFVSSCGIKHRRITPLWPEANGTAERFMGTLNKFVRALVTENLDWRVELQNFLMHYRATPHSSTQISPFEALTGRKMNMGLPDIPKSDAIPLTIRMSHNDAVSKYKMKEYADKRRHTTPSKITPGDQVLVRQRKTDKLTPPYNPEPYTVVEKRGSMVTANKNGHSITRNSSHFKPVVAPDIPEEEEIESNPSSTQEPSIDSPVSSPTPISPVAKCISPAMPRRNPSRSADMPKRFADYEIG